MISDYRVKEIADKCPEFLYLNGVKTLFFYETNLRKLNLSHLESSYQRIIEAKQDIAELVQSQNNRFTPNQSVLLARLLDQSEFFIEVYEKIKIENQIKLDSLRTELIDNIANYILANRPGLSPKSLETLLLEIQRKEIDPLLDSEVVYRKDGTIDNLQIAIKILVETKYQALVDSFSERIDTLLEQQFYDL